MYSFNMVKSINEGPKILIENIRYEKNIIARCCVSETFLYFIFARCRLRFTNYASILPLRLNHIVWYMYMKQTKVLLLHTNVSLLSRFLGSCYFLVLDKLKPKCWCIIQTLVCCLAFLGSCYFLVLDKFLVLLSKEKYLKYYYTSFSQHECY
jgi:hypothetical protein